MLDGKIILVDDNEAVLKTLKMILAREFKTLVGVSVPTLLPALLREGDVDIVLLDMNFDGRPWLRSMASPAAFSRSESMSTSSEYSPRCIREGYRFSIGKSNRGGVLRNS